MSEDAHELVCSGCGCQRDTKGWYCRSCRAAYMRNWRAKEQRELRHLRHITRGLLRESMDDNRADGAVPVSTATTT